MATEDGFEVFRARKAPSVPHALVTIQHKGVLSLNRRAFELLGEPAAVEFLFNRTTRVIGIRAADLLAGHAYPLRKQTNSATYTVGAKSFIGTYGIDISQTRRYVATLNGSMLTVDLVQANQVTPRNRGQANGDRRTG